METAAIPVHEEVEMRKTKAKRLRKVFIQAVRTEAPGLLQVGMVRGDHGENVAPLRSSWRKFKRRAK